MRKYWEPIKVIIFCLILIGTGVLWGRYAFGDHSPAERLNLPAPQACWLESTGSGPEPVCGDPATIQRDYFIRWIPVQPIAGMFDLLLHDTSPASSDGRFHGCGVVTPQGVTENLNIYKKRCPNG